VARSRDYFYRGKLKTITYTGSLFVALDNQHAMRMRRVMLSYVACPAQPYFSHIISQTGTIFGEKRSYWA